MIQARPCLNGNTRNDFMEVIDRLGEAKDAIDKAYSAMMGDVLNGRNYQHLADYHPAMTADRNAAFYTYLSICDHIKTLQKNIDNALEESANV